MTKWEVQALLEVNLFVFLVDDEVEHPYHKGDAKGVPKRNTSECNSGVGGRYMLNPDNNRRSIEIFLLVLKVSQTKLNLFDAVLVLIILLFCVFLQRETP